MDTIRLSQAEMVLQAAATLGVPGQPFTIEELVVATWSSYKQTFGLRGFEMKYPHSAKIVSIVVGQVGLTAKGFLEKVGPNLYALTTKGKLLADGRAAEEPVPSTEPRPAGASEEAFLAPLLGSIAATKCDGNRRAGLSFADACAFWGLRQDRPVANLDERIDLLTYRPLLKMAEECEFQPLKLSCGRIVRSGDIRVLLNVHRFMLEKFAKHLTLLRARKAGKAS